MIRFCKIIFDALFFCQIIFISCKTKSQSANKNIAPYTVEADSALYHFKHHFNDRLPAPQNYVSDYENLFTPQQEDSLNHLINLFEKQTTNQIALVSFDTTMVTKQNFEELTLRLANAWGIGDKDKQNGILIGICAGYKKIRIQNGKGIEKILSNQATKNIIDSSFIPYFKAANYFSGTLNGVKAIIQKLNQ